jgi:hypothetical protein
VRKEPERSWKQRLKEPVFSPSLQLRHCSVGRMASGNSTRNKVPSAQPFHSGVHQRSSSLKVPEHQLCVHPQDVVADEAATQKAIGPQGLKGLFETTVEVGGHTVSVNGRVIDGTARIGSFWLP